MKRTKPAYESFEYNSINTFVINRIVEKVGGKQLHEQQSERVWSKLGMEHDADILVSTSGKPLGFIGVNTSVRDMARFGMAFTPSYTKIAGNGSYPKPYWIRFRRPLIQKCTTLPLQKNNSRLLSQMLMG